MENVQINLVCCTQVICNELSHRECTQKGLASTYALAIKSELQLADRPDWKIINKAVMDRWGQRGLTRVKRLAWAIIKRHAAGQTH